MENEKEVKELALMIGIVEDHDDATRVAEYLIKEGYRQQPPANEVRICENCGNTKCICKECKHEWSVLAIGSAYQFCLKEGCNVKMFDNSHGKDNCIKEHVGQFGEIGCKCSSCISSSTMDILQIIKDAGYSKQETGLVPLDEKELHREWFKFSPSMDSIVAQFIKYICAKFSAPRRMTVNEWFNVIHNTNVSPDKKYKCYVKKEVAEDIAQSVFDAQEKGGV